MSFFYDLVLVLLFLYLVGRGWRRGVFYTLLRLLGWVAAAFVIMSWGTQWAQSIYHSVVESRVVSAVSAAIPTDALAAMHSSADAMASLQVMLDSLSGVLGGLTIDTSATNAIIALLQQDSTSLAQAITQTVLQPVVIRIIQIVLDVGIVIVCLFVFRFFARATQGRRHNNSVLGKTNQILGGVLGVGEGCLVGYVYAYVLSFLAGVLTVSWLTPSILGNTTLISRILAL